MIKRFLVWLVALAMVCLGYQAVTISNSDAHTPGGNGTCTGVHGQGASYNASHGNANSYVIKIDGNVVASASFASSFDKTVPAPQDTHSHPWSVKINAWDDPTGSHGWTKEFSGNLGPCVTVQKNATASVNTTPGTCFEVGSATHSENHAHLVGAFDTSVGNHTQRFDADQGSAFADGSSTKNISYTVAGKNHDLCGHVAPAEPGINQAVCTKATGHLTLSTVTLPQNDPNFSYSVVYKYALDSQRSSAVVTATLLNPDTQNLDVPAGWVRTGPTTLTTEVGFAHVHCVVPPKCTACHLPKFPHSQGVLNCRGIYSGGTYSKVVVAAGRDCTLVDVKVNGSIRANHASDLRLGNVTVRGSVYASHIVNTFQFGATNGTCNADPRVGGSLFVIGSHNVVICKAQVCHKIVVKGATGRVMIRDSRTNKLVVKHNDRFFKDGHETHGAIHAIRVFDVKAHQFVVKHNKRPVLSHRLQHVARIGGHKVCLV